MFNKTANKVCLALMVAFFISYGVEVASATQQAANNPAAADNRATGDKREGTAPPVAVEDRLKALEQVIERQQREIQTLRELIEKRGAATPPAATPEAAAAREASQQTPASGRSEAAPPESA